MTQRTEKILELQRDLDILQEKYDRLVTERNSIAVAEAHAMEVVGELERVRALLRQSEEELSTRYEQARTQNEVLLAALPDIKLLARVAEALAYRGIEPASDVEKLRVAAGAVRAAIASPEVQR